MTHQRDPSAQPRLSYCKVWFGAVCISSMSRGCAPSSLGFAGSKRKLPPLVFARPPQNLLEAHN